MADAEIPRSNRTVETIRGQYHKFMLIPLIERHSRWFDAGLVSIAVEARALGDSAERMVTRVQPLSAGSRREEVARMLSGAQVTEAARAQADELLRAKG